MKLKANQLNSHLQQGLAKIYLLAGDEPLQLQECADQIRVAAREQGFTEREVRSVDKSFSWDELTMLSSSMSLFGDRKLIELHLPTGKPGDQGARALREYVEQSSDDNCLMILCGKMDAASLRTKWAQALEQAGVLIQVWPLEGVQLQQWIGSRMQSLDMQPSADAVNLLVERVEGNLLAAAQEIDKLSLLHGGGRIDVQAVAEAVADSTRYNIYHLVDIALSGKSEKFVKILNGLKAEGTEPVIVLWALNREIRSLSGMAAEVRKGTAIEAVFSRQRIWERRKPLINQALKRHGLGRWYGFIQHGARIDRIIKGMEGGKAWDELLQLGLSIAGNHLLEIK